MQRPRMFGEEKKMSFEIRDKKGNTRFTAKDREQAGEYYAIVKQEEGYAEVWENGKRFFRTPGYVAHPMRTAIVISVIASTVTAILLQLLLWMLSPPQ